MKATNVRFPARGDALPALRILVVDDDRDTRHLLFEALRCFGAEVRTAAGVAQAREQLARWRADVLLSDLNMPDEDGYVLIREIRMRPLDGERTMPAIALTGTTQAGDRRRAREAGYNEVLAKPAELQDLLEAIRRVASADPRRP